MTRIKGFFALAFIVAGIVLFFNSCSKSGYPRPTDAYYLNDYADALSGAA